jgi:hypothetical protein
MAYLLMDYRNLHRILYHVFILNIKLLMLSVTYQISLVFHTLSCYVFNHNRLLYIALRHVLNKD